jgi:hypothetical protein
LESAAARSAMPLTVMAPETAGTMTATTTWRMSDSFAYHINAPEAS